MVEYLTRYNSAEDPGGLIREVVEMGDDFPGPAREALLSWVLKLEAGLDPADAAKTLLDRYEIAQGEVPDTPCGELIGLLRETARSGLASIQSGNRPKRRGGWRRHNRDGLTQSDS